MVEVVTGFYRGCKGRVIRTFFKYCTRRYEVDLEGSDDWVKCKEKDLVSIDKELKGKEFDDALRKALEIK
jgi:hypothetical protein